MAIFKYIVGLFVAPAVISQSVIDLSGSSWTLTNPPHNNISVRGHVPSQAHLDLYASHMITDP
jgi:beta-mannosidase